MKRLSSLISLLFCICVLYAQVETRYIRDARTSPMISEAISMAKAVKVHRMPSFDVEELLKEDMENANLDIPYRFGKGFDVSLCLDDGECR